MKRFFLTFIILYSLVFNVLSQWDDLNTGINDDLTGVVFRGDTGLVSGHHGLYYTTNGGMGGASWTQYAIVGNAADSLIYEQTKFLNCFSSPDDSNHVYACGQDTVNDQAVIFQLTLGSWVHELLYVGSTGSYLEDINHSEFSSNYYAVGGNGLCVRFSTSTMGVEEPLGVSLDFTSISFDGSKFWIGTSNHRIFGLDNNPGLTITTNDFIPTWDLQDVHCLPGGLGFGVGDSPLHTDGMNYDLLSNYDFAPLNAKCLAVKFDYRYIGTDKGIYRTYDNAIPSDANPFEWQYSSQGYSISEMWNEDHEDEIYACGEDGAVLKIAGFDLGGDTKPRVSIYMGPNGGCQDQYTSLYSHMGSAEYGTWYVDGQQVSLNDQYYSHLYDSAGVYQVEYIATHQWVGGDTASFTLEITPMPDDSISFSIADTIICHSESIEINIDSSELNVFYTLYNLSQDDFGDSQVGNGGMLNYTTDAVSDSGEYYLMATSSINENCQIELIDEIYLSGEWTTADFYPSHINCEPSESVKYFNQSRDADNYSWTFESNANVGTSNLFEPVNSYTGPSTPDSIELVCWSNNGCYDTLYKNGPNVVSLPSQVDSSWVSANQSPLEAPYGLDPEMYRMISLQDGYLISGRYYEETFATRYGDSINFSGDGGFLLKYDFRGMLKWSIYTDGVIEDLAEDQNGNIYALGSGEEIVVDNSHDTIFLPDWTNYDEKGFIMKLDSLGDLQWYRRSNNIRPYHISIGYDGRPVVGAGTRDHFPGIITLDFNGVPADTMSVSTGVNRDHVILKLDTNGSIMWNVPMTIEGGNISTIRGIDMDSDHNVYITGAFEDRVVTYATNTSSSDTISGYSGVYGGHLFLTKLDETGGLLWQTKALSVNSQLDPQGGTAPYDMKVDSVGNCYLSGKNRSDYIPNTFQFYNTGGTVHSYKGGETFIMKVDSSGVCSWMKCGQYSNYGIISRLFLENEKLYALGWIDENYSYSGIPNVTFYNSDSTAIQLFSDRPNYFVAEFDTSGYIHSLFKNSDDTGSSIITGTVNDWAGFFKHSDSSFYTTRNVFIYPGTTYDEFGHTMSSDDHDTWVVKARPEDGIDVPMIYLYRVEDTICTGDSYLLPDNSLVTLTNDFVDTTTLTSVEGMDSIIITDLKVITAFNTYQSDSVCPGSTYTFPDGSSSVISNPMTHSSYFVSNIGCDSIVTTDVGLYPSEYIVLEDFVCSGTNYVFPDGTSSLITGPVTHESHFINTEGCDSTIETTVNVHPDINTNVDSWGGTLQAQAGGLIYQWVECNIGYAPIPGETDRTFYPSVDGLYAVVIDDGSCVDTSDCISFDYVNLDQDSLSSLKLHPNPATNEVYIYFKTDSHHVIILDVLGREVLSVQDVHSGDHLDVSKLAPGQYTVMLKDERVNKRLIVK